MCTEDKQDTPLIKIKLIANGDLEINGELVKKTEIKDFINDIAEPNKFSFVLMREFPSSKTSLKEVFESIEKITPNVYLATEDDYPGDQIKFLEIEESPLNFRFYYNAHEGIFYSDMKNNKTLKSNEKIPLHLLKSIELLIDSNRILDLKSKNEDSAFSPKTLKLNGIHLRIITNNDSSFQYFGNDVNLYGFKTGIKSIIENNFKSLKN
ncbi:hypothetical protein EHS15_04825 [Leptospira idonii]|uniref:Uncharacterized protein n=2 Tax=Leptospira idonii TaxID=1193500 RepID=A0A4R9M2C5_9LEPT|nr:hypothetical protein EHS15_04825 [Leptospira idonii]